MPSFTTETRINFAVFVVTEVAHAKSFHLRVVLFLLPTDVVPVFQPLIQGRHSSSICIPRDKILRFNPKNSRRIIMKKCCHLQGYSSV
jgi:hypothetical protein